MKKIVFFINTIQGGGAERVIVQLANAFANDIFDVVMVTSFAVNGEFQLDSKIKRIILEESGEEKSIIKRNVGRILKLRRICKREKADVIVSFMAESNVRAVISTFGLSTKSIISVRNDPNRDYEGILGKLVGKYLLPFSDGCVFQTSDARAWFPKRLQNKSKIIFNAVKADFFSEEYCPSNNSLVVSVGRLEPQKNHKLLIDAIKIAKDCIPTIKCIIYGEGKQREELEKYISELDLKQHIELPGEVKNVNKVLKRADVFVLSSEYEGMPNALLEALAIGVPSISTDCPCGGPKMLAEDFNACTVVPLNDAVALSNEIVYLLENEKIREDIHRKTKAAANIFKPVAVYEEWKEYLTEVWED